MTIIPSHLQSRKLGALIIAGAVICGLVSLHATENVILAWLGLGSLAIGGQAFIDHINGIKNGGGPPNA